MRNTKAISDYIDSSPNKEKLKAALASLFGEPRIQNTQPMEQERGASVIEVLAFGEIATFDK